MSGTTTTRAVLREMVRRRLADTSAEPLWETDLLDDAIAEAVRRYSDRFPRETASSLSVTAGVRTVTIPAEVNPARIERLFDDRGDAWRPWMDVLGEAPPTATAPPTGERMWRVWGSELLLASPAPRDGTWRLEHLAERTIPSDDETPMDFAAGDDDIHIALAMQVALMRRAIADGKIGRASGTGRHPLVEAAQLAKADADQLFWLRRRRAKGSLLGTLELGGAR